MTQQDEYFSVQLGLTINVERLSSNESVPDEQDFNAEIPPLFRIASECSTLEDNADRLFASFNKNETQALMDYLAAQNSKINLLLSYVLSQQDDPTYRFTTLTFGASNLSFTSSSSYQVGSNVRVKLFLDYPAAAIFCYAEVTESIASDEQFIIKLRYTRLLEDDRDLLIRAALYSQQKLLRQRAQQRQLNNNDE
ncbi:MULTISPECIES: PilZ domain-containing protein [unclassified Photobacterium]|uniref:PilZ domain-containing protein n=1 Tax=unclassified Photobacterium TaxID=2628852 RepID=UPI001EDDECA3|nr:MULTISPECIES: PilZ domain-containing protein [unclassified Photobacterium]MCG3866196.1 PilZ domain-containing protein [Photobacterium sp. Ph6]MCG3877725.1 PilZ domain-containing protein [Photobacterium sp. Ph5]